MSGRRSSHSILFCVACGRVAWGGVAWGIVALLGPVSLPAQESHDFGFRLESSLVPDLDETSTIVGEEGETIPFTIVLDLGSTRSDGFVQGWSLSVWTAGFEIDSVSVDDTIVDLKVFGGIVDPDGGFVAFDIVDPDLFDNDGRTGIVQAVVPCVFDCIRLPLGHRYAIGNVHCRALLSAPGRTGFVRYEDGLRGRGQPVVNVLTVFGQSAEAALGHREITILREVDPEACDDGIDNDGDGWADGADPDCQPARPRELCEDGVDNDGDGAVDCEDSECFFSPPCPPVEVCGDGLDNDRDGDADCDDTDCEGHPFCIAREICDDGVDNDNDGLADCNDRDCGGVPPCPVIERCLDQMDDDGDGLIDCDDPDCLDTPFCGFFEACSDGEDNNRDGLVDCEDPQCADGPACVDPEICDDGVDNDGDGRVDCDDSQCRGVGACPGPERCGDGRDNDRDGDTDCDDSDCVRHPLCIDPEICDDGIDNDGDGRVDCDDSQCRGRGDCPGPEQCADGIDNDRDGAIDCEDPECRTRAHCRSERCDDGIDNDIDGLVDCDDPSCVGVAGCVREICDNGIDDDGDGFTDCDDPFCRHRSPCGADENGFELVLVAEGALRENPAADGGGAGHGDGGGVGRPRQDPTNVVEVEYVSSRTIEVVTYIVPFPTAQPAGVQGWSLSIAHDTGLMSLVGAPTIEGTDAGDFFSGGFEKTETAGGRRGDGGGAGQEDEVGGVVSAVVLSFTQPSTLDPSIAQSILRTTYELNSQVGLGGPGVVRFQDGLQGSGQPVANLLTIRGATVKPVHLVPLEIRRGALFGQFVRGDINTDGKVDIADAVWALSDLMRGGPPTSCPAAADVNDDGAYDIADPVYLLQHRFLHGPTIPAPYPNCGASVDESELPCPEGVAPLCAR